MDEVFYKISKIIIFLPIIIIFIGLIIRLGESLNFNFQQKYNHKINITISPSVFLSKNPSKKIEKIGINLDDHWVCQYDFDNKKYKLEINKRKINLEVLEKSRVEKYDLSVYTPIIENYLNIDINQLEKMFELYFPKGVDLKTLVKGCKKI